MTVTVAVLFSGIVTCWPSPSVTTTTFVVCSVPLAVSVIVHVDPDGMPL